ncbi:MAG: DegT/DnrJ/EryC1/StrS family aminotransferase [Chitinophagales bacterium]|nr:DegT/DnrJ/EryC1/StrS family aminotransferase [Hyphomicrobiales bacterium]
MIPIAKPFLGDEEAAAAADVVRSGWLTQGPRAAAFERSFAQTVNAPHACAVSNCTTALHLALVAAGVGPGDEVITASHSFIATANAILQTGATPVFADVEPRMFNLDPESVEEAITPKTRALLVVHQMGMPADMERLTRLAERSGIVLVEDAACGLGSEILYRGQWRKIGNPFGASACFSLHPRKIITVGDGGVITTNDASSDAQFRLLRQHGMNVPDTVRHASPQIIFESYDLPAYNYRLTDIQAAIGSVQLSRLPEIVARRRYLGDRYAELLAQSAPEVTPPYEPDWAKTNWQSYCIWLPRGVDQRAVMQKMLDLGVSTRRGIMCSHREPAYREMPLRLPLPRSEEAQDRCILLPLFPHLTESEQEQVVEALVMAVRGGV